MTGIFNPQGHEEGQHRNDTELTLSSTAVFGIFFGLVLLCGVFFGLGFAVGHRSGSQAPAAAPVQTVATPQTLPADLSRPKPSPTSQTASAQQPPSAVSLPVSSDTNATVNPAPSGPAPGTAWAVRPALPPGGAGQPQGALPSQSAGGAAFVPPGGLMVQIAAVTHPEDAEVLVAALQKRGYAVIARRAPVDGLIHVQTGPFTNRNDANEMRQKLLNDGYNAIVQP